MRVDYDTMLFFQVAAQQPPRLHGSFQAIDAGHVQLCMSLELLDEFVHVLSRPEFQGNARHFTPDLAQQFFAKIKSVALWFDSVPKLFTIPKHSKDDHLFNLAIAAQADRLVTWESRLLGLQDENSQDGQRLRNLAPELKIITPLVLLNELRV